MTLVELCYPKGRYIRGAFFELSWDFDSGHYDDWRSELDELLICESDDTIVVPPPLTGNGRVLVQANWEPSTDSRDGMYDSPICPECRDRIGPVREAIGRLKPRRITISLYGAFPSPSEDDVNPIIPSPDVMGGGLFIRPDVASAITEAGFSGADVLDVTVVEPGARLYKPPLIRPVATFFAKDRFPELVLECERPEDNHCPFCGQTPLWCTHCGGGLDAGENCWRCGKRVFLSQHDSANVKKKRRRGFIRPAPSANAMVRIDARKWLGQDIVGWYSMRPIVTRRLAMWMKEREYGPFVARPICAFVDGLTNRQVEQLQEAMGGVLLESAPQADESTSDGVATVYGGLLRGANILVGILDQECVELMEQGRFDRAIEVASEALRVSESTLGHDHLEVAARLDVLVRLYETCGAYGNAAEQCERALAIREEALGPDHLDVATNLSALGGLRQIQGAYGSARALHERALTIREKELGPEHPDVAESLNCLGGILHAQGNYAHAHALYERALVIRNKAFGPNHPDVANSLNNLAGLFDSQRAYDKSKSLYEQALAIQENALGPDHFVVAITLNNLAGLCLEQGQHREAVEFYERAKRIFDERIEPGHPKMISLLENLAEAYRSVNRDDEALALERRVARINSIQNEKDRRGT